MCDQGIAIINHPLGEVCVMIQRDHNRYRWPQQLSTSLKQVAFRVGLIFSFTGTMQVEIEALDRTGGAEPCLDFLIEVGQGWGSDFATCPSPATDNRQRCPGFTGCSSSLQESSQRAGCGDCFKYLLALRQSIDAEGIKRGGDGTETACFLPVLSDSNSHGSQVQHQHPWDAGATSCRTGC